MDLDKDIGDSLIELNDHLCSSCDKIKNVKIL